MKGRQEKKVRFGDQCVGHSQRLTGPPGVSTEKTL